MDAYKTSGTSPPTEPGNQEGQGVEPVTPIEAARQAVKDALTLARSARERIDSVKVENRERIVAAKEDAEQAEETARAVIGRVLADLAFSGDLDAFIGPKVRKASADLDDAIYDAQQAERYAAETRQRLVDIASGKPKAAKRNGVLS